MSLYDLIFWDVDTQEDFMLPGGKLYVPRAEQIISNLVRLTEHARERQILIVASTDAHQPDDPEFAAYPPHCVAGTPGQQKIRETKLGDAYVVPNRPMELPPLSALSGYRQVIVEKQKLDVFTNPNIDALVRMLGLKEIVLYGVVTELCVECAARGLLERGYRVRLVTDAACALDEAKAREFVREFEQRGGKLCTTEQVVGDIR